jgi:hypothetical protein
MVCARRDEASILLFLLAIHIKSFCTGSAKICQEPLQRGKELKNQGVRWFWPGNRSAILNVSVFQGAFSSAWPTPTIYTV